MITIHLLGSPRLLSGDRPVALGRRRAVALLAYLALAPAPSPRERLLGLLWPDFATADARNNLRRELSHLREALGADSVVADRAVAGLNPEALARGDIRVDVRDFMSYVNVARDHFRDPTHGHTELCDVCLNVLEAAAATYTGDFLDGFVLPDSPPFDEWQSLESARLRSDALWAMNRLMAHFTPRDADRTDALAWRVLELDPFDEAAHRALLAHMAAAGRLAAARQHYDHLRDNLQRELGVAPDATTQALMDAVEREARGAPLPGIGSTPTVPVTAHPTADGQSSRISGNLPADATSFVGRARELAQAHALLGETRLLTLTGPGGTGKTRLALRLAREATGGYAAGAWLVELAPITDPTQVPAAVAAVFDLQEQAGQSLEALLVSYLAGRELLLVLDNCEHVIDNAARLAAELLRRCPALTILATSREGLGIAGETVFAVPPLSLPDDGATAVDLRERSEAAALFLDRARAARPDFSLSPANAPAVAQIVTRLDGLPLALELAAARVRVFAVDQIAARLDDSFNLLSAGDRAEMPRHQTLRALIDWSHDLLADDERVLFRRLGVFAGGWTFAAAEAVMGEDAPCVLEQLPQLVNKSLVTVSHEGSEPRYSYLETIRAYAQERLDEAGERDLIMGRVLRHLAALAEAAEPQLRGHGQLAWIRLLDAERDNIHLALKWGADHDPDTAARVAAALWHYWFMRGVTVRARRYYDMLDARVGPRGAELRRALRGRYLVGYASTIWPLGSPALARPLLEDAVRLFRAAGDDWWTGLALEHLACVAGWEGHFDRELAQLEEALLYAERAGEPWLIKDSQQILGWVLARLGHFDEAEALYRTVSRVNIETGDLWFEAHNMADLGWLLWRTGRYDEARVALFEALVPAQAFNDRFQTARIHVWLGYVALDQGDLTTARAEAEAADTLYRDAGVRNTWPDAPELMAEIAAREGDIATAVMYLREALAICEAIGDGDGPQRIRARLADLGVI